MAILRMGNIGHDVPRRKLSIGKPVTEIYMLTERVAHLTAGAPARM